MPVPTVSPNIDSLPRPAPCHHSPYTAQFASLSSATGASKRCRRRRRSGTSRQPRLGLSDTTPVARSRGPGEPTPMPITSVVAMPADSIAPPTIRTMSSTTASTPRSARVARLRSATASPPASGTSPTTALVPPMSTPAIQLIDSLRGRGSPARPREAIDSCLNAVVQLREPAFGQGRAALPHHAAPLELTANRRFVPVRPVVVEVEDHGAVPHLPSPQAGVLETQSELTVESAVAEVEVEAVHRLEVLPPGGRAHPVPCRARGRESIEQ